MKMKSVTWAVTLLLAGTAIGFASANEPSLPPKPFTVLLIGNSQCPTIVRHRLLETLAASDKGARPIKVGGCIKGGASLRSHWEAGTSPTTARGMIASGSWDYVVLQDIYNVEKPAFSTGLSHLAPCCGFEEPRVGAGVGFDAFLRAAVGLHIVCWVWDLAFAVPSLL
jgi:hypothetical protein